MRKLHPILFVLKQLLTRREINGRFKVWIKFSWRNVFEVGIKLAKIKVEKIVVGAICLPFTSSIINVRGRLFSDDWNPLMSKILIKSDNQRST